VAQIEMVALSSFCKRAKSHWKRRRFKDGGGSERGKTNQALQTLPVKVWATFQSISSVHSDFS
jgi:hypothetical protein